MRTAIAVGALLLPQLDFLKVASAVLVGQPPAPAAPTEGVAACCAAPEPFLGFFKSCWRFTVVPQEGGTCKKGQVVLNFDYERFLDGLVEAQEKKQPNMKPEDVREKLREKLRESTTNYALPTQCDLPAVTQWALSPFPGRKRDGKVLMVRELPKEVQHARDRWHKTVVGFVAKCAGGPSELSGYGLQELLMFEQMEVDCHGCLKAEKPVDCLTKRRAECSIPDDKTTCVKKEDDVNVAKHCLALTEGNAKRRRWTREVEDLKAAGEGQTEKKEVTTK